MIYTIGDCVIIVDETHHTIETVFQDGASLGFCPEYDVFEWEKERDHILAHAWLAERNNLQYSPTLYRFSHPDAPTYVSDRQVMWEEKAVAEWLATHTERPWNE